MTDLFASAAAAGEDWAMAKAWTVALAAGGWRSRKMAIACGCETPEKWAAALREARADGERSGPAAHAAPAVTAIAEIIAHFEKEAAFNVFWQGEHLKDGKPAAAECREAHVAKLRGWLAALRQVARP